MGRTSQVLARAARAAFQAGRVAEAADAYEEAIAGFAAEGDLVGQGETLSRLSSVLWNQGEARRAREVLLRAVELLEQAQPGPDDDLQLLVPALAVAAAVAQAAGEHTAARGLVEEVHRVVGDRGGGRWPLAQHVAELVRVCVALGERATGEALAAQAHDGVARNRHGLLTARAALAQAEGALDQAAQGYDETAARWADYGHQLERARALLGAGRCLLILGRPEGQLRLQDAHTALMALNAQPLAEADAALSSATALRYTGWDRRAIPSASPLSLRLHCWRSEK